MNAEQRRAHILSIVDEGAAERGNGRVCVGVELIGKVCRVKYNDGRTIRRNLSDEFFNELIAPEY